MKKGFQPYIPVYSTAFYLGLKAVKAGVVFGMVIGTANAHPELQMGLTIGTIIQLPVLSGVLFKALQPSLGNSSLLESKNPQTIRSASSSLISGILFIIPAWFVYQSVADLVLPKITPLGVYGGTAFLSPAHDPGG